MISTDTIEDNTRFAKEHDADYPILSDVSKEIANKYGVLGKAGFANRWTFYIGPDGKILHIDNAVKPASSGPDIVAKLGELKIAKRKK
jgi:peroxiredoxin Q/BCP